MYFVLEMQLSVPISISVRLGACAASQDTGNELCADSSYHPSVFFIKLFLPGLNVFCFPFFKSRGCYPLKSTQPIITAVSFKKSRKLDRMLMHSPVLFFFLIQFNVFQFSTSVHLFQSSKELLSRGDKRMIEAHLFAES